MKRWQLQEAKARLSEVVRAAQHSPQEISVRGEPAVVVLSRRDYERLAGSKPRFIDFIQQSPLAGLDFSIERDRSSARDIAL